MRQYAKKSAVVRRASDAEPHPRITLSKLAEHLRLSRTTISLILNDVPEAIRFSEETRQRVVETAKKLGYRPNYFARSLGKRRNYLIGVLAPDFGNGFEATVLSGFERGLLHTEYTSFISTHLWSPALLREHIQTLCDRGVEGLLLINSSPTEAPAVPTVSVGTHQTPRWCTHVSIDNALGMDKAIKYLAELGHREIAFIKGPDGSGDTEERWNAILVTCKSLGLKVDPLLTVQLELLEPRGTRHAEEGRVAARALLRPGKRFTAVVTFNDISALGVMTALREAGLRVPEDVSVIGFDDIEFASIAYPPLTTVRQPLHEMGSMAAELLLRKLSNDESVGSVRISPDLVIRSSTCAPSRPARNARSPQRKSSR